MLYTSCACTPRARHALIAPGMSNQFYSLSCQREGQEEVARVSLHNAACWRPICITISNRRAMCDVTCTAVPVVSCDCHCERTALQAPAPAR